MEALRQRPAAGALAAALALFAAPGASLAQPAPLAELYIADVSEAPPELGLASAIELHPGGRFDWRFTLDGVTLTARGEWERDGETISLHNPDQAGEPRLELVGSARDPVDLLHVVLEPATARMAPLLEVEVEYPGYSFSRLPFAKDGAVRIVSADQSPVAVRIVSERYTMRTQPIELTLEGDNVLTVRLEPPNLGQAFFASQSNVPLDGGMTLSWRGIALRYDPAPRLTGGEGAAAPAALPSPVP